MIEGILRNKQFRRYFPPFAAIVFTILFVSLGFWQLDRAAQKRDLLASFADSGNDSESTGHMPLDGKLPDRPFQPIEARGRYDSQRQVLLENIVRDGRIGYFVITPFQQSGENALLLVNRGWLPMPDRDSGKSPQIDVDTQVRVLRGRAGQLPRVSVRPGEAFEGAADWPRHATYPLLDEVAAQLGTELLPFVLLLDPDQDDGFRREWQPQVSGPMTNYSYAFQWFAMAAAVMVILVWQLRKRARS